MRATNNLYLVESVAASVVFYEKLGFAKKVDEGGDAWAEVALGDFSLMLIAVGDSNGPEFVKDEQAKDKGMGMYLFVQTDDVDATYKDLIGRKVAVKNPPRDWPWGNREFVVKDPDGFKTVFWMPIKGGK